MPTGRVWRKISPYRPRAERLAAAAAGEYVPPEVPYSVVLSMLNRLAQRKDVEKITIAEMRPCYWRRWPQQAERRQADDRDRTRG